MLWKLLQSDSQTTFVNRQAEKFKDQALKQPHMKKIIFLE